MSQRIRCRRSRFIFNGSPFVILPASGTLNKGSVKTPGRLWVL
nr:MAG TPA: hypothetical protein [Caudoviricetes sp.]